jgi:pSer/pThr/pTyr-binding forkhead associated (FHA) protein
MEVTLVVLEGVHKGRHIPISTAQFLIGRAKHCQLRPVRQDVGREHCALSVRDGRVFLRDCGSTNGTILNNRLLGDTDTEIADGDVFEVGPLRFRVVIVRSEEEESLFSVNELFTGQPDEHEPGADSTIQITSPKLPKTLPDEGEKLC